MRFQSLDRQPRTFAQDAYVPATEAGVEVGSFNLQIEPATKLQAHRFYLRVSEWLAERGTEPG